jgi:hypothetical protein
MPLDGSHAEAATRQESAITTRSYEDLLGFRLDLEPSSTEHAPRTLAADYEPLPLWFLGVEGGAGRNPAATLDVLIPRLRMAASIARPDTMRARARPGEASVRLHAAIVRAPLVARELTSAAEIAGQLSPWRVVASFGWRGVEGEAPRDSAYELLRRLDISG